MDAVALQQQFQDPIYLPIELLEAILFQLDIKQLLLLQRVSRPWHDLIRKSPMLQQKLFFRPCTNRSLPPQFNPLLQSLFPPFFNLNYPIFSYGDYHGATSIREEPWYLDENRRAVVLRVDASWRRMFPVQPPAKINMFKRRGFEACTYDLDVERGMVQNQFMYLQKDGTTMGFLFDVTIYLIDHLAEACFFIEWHMFQGIAKYHDYDTPLVSPSLSLSASSGTETVEKKGITVHIYYWLLCHAYKAEIQPSLLKIADCDKDLIKWWEDPDESTI